MTSESLTDCINEAIRFIEAAKKARFKIQTNTDGYGCKETAAAKRASMDLTRALADLRAGR